MRKPPRIVIAGSPGSGKSRQEYGQRSLYTQGMPIQVAAGENLKDLAIRLIPGRVVSGRISDETGQPAVDVPVQLLRVAYNAQGKTHQAIWHGHCK